jgi:Ca2+-binding RTX toxin-like protein
VTLATLGAVTNASIKVTGAAGNENITGSAAADSISGLGGADTLVGGGGNDTLLGGAGADSLSGGLGDDLFLFTAGSDIAAGETIDGGAGTNTLRFSQTLDASGATLSNLQALVIDDGFTVTFDGSQITGKTWTVTGVAGGGTETLVVNAASGATVDLSTLGAVTNVGIQLNGAGGNESLIGSGAADTISGVGGADTLAGNGGADVVTGGSGTDSLAGGLGADSLDGAGNDDTLVGGAGADTLHGNSGADVFVFGAGDTGTTAGTVDEILDFNAGTDFLSLGVAGSASNYAESLANAGSLAGAITTAQGLMDGTVRFVFVVVGADGYMLVDRNGDAAVDEAIKLTGVTDLSFGDVIA